MNSKLNDFKKKIKNKKVAVLGIGISHTPLISYLYKLGADITAFDKSDETRLKLHWKRLKVWILNIVLAKVISII